MHIIKWQGNHCFTVFIKREDLKYNYERLKNYNRRLEAYSRYGQQLQASANSQY